VADIGPDHGYLGMLLMRDGTSPRVIMTDIAEGPLSIARENFERYLGLSGAVGGSGDVGDTGGLSDIGPSNTGGPSDIDAADPADAADATCDFRLGDGLVPLGFGEADAVVIAGMGGETIIEMLEADPAKTRSFPKYILQPRTKVELLREWLAGRFEIAAEDTVEERGRDCAIIVARPL
jgi:tRNA (adenine22-N1)-methyltransferase